MKQRGKYMIGNRFSLAAILFSTLSIGACTEAVGEPGGPDEVDTSEDELSSSGTEYKFYCKGANGISTRVDVAANDGGFDVTATAKGNVVFKSTGQRPSLNVRLEDDASTAVNEFIDFSDKGLESVPVDGPKALEIDLFGSKALLFKDPAQTTQMSCRLDRDRLVKFLKFDLISTPDVTGVKAVAFDIDDALAFTTPAFVRGFATGGTPGPTDTLFWTHVNGCDSGCSEETITLPDGMTKLLPANVASTAKSKALSLVRFHKARGHKVYAITARPDINGGPLRDYAQQVLGLAPSDVFFEPDLDQPGNPKGKTDRIESLDLDIFYGDSDSDITDAMKAFADASGARTKTVRAVRFFRSPKSSNRKAGKLNKYHPGYFGEAILRHSYD